MKRTMRLIALTACLAAIVAVPAAAKHPAAPRNQNQAVADGCQRSVVSGGFDFSPEWVYVYRNPAIRRASGVVRVVHPAKDDDQLTHTWFDFNANLVPDPGSRYLLGGRRSPATNNYAGDPQSNDAEEIGRLHFEWESQSLPFFAWPTDGDRVTIWGSWIWDCLHFTTAENGQGGSFTGERTELHPLNAIVVNRRAPYLPGRPESETDAYISNDGTVAHAVEQCALSHHPASSSTYDSGFTPCTHEGQNRTQPLERRYSFFVAAPPRPSGAARLKWRVVSRITHSGGRQTVRVRRNGLSVTVKVPRGRHRFRYGKSFFVSWTGGHAKHPTTLRVTIKSLLVRQSDPNPALADPDGPVWNVYLNVNGYWKLLNDWAPKLYHPHDGQLIRINRTFKIHVPAGAGVWLETTGRECDEPNGGTLFGLTATVLHPCLANVSEVAKNVNDLTTNDDIGIVLDTYRSARAALGRHASTSHARVRWPRAGRITLGDGQQGTGAYQLIYTVRRG